MPKQKVKARERLYRQQGGRCYYCGCKTFLPKGPFPSTKPALATLDHIIPKSQGGANAPTENCVLACQQCNQERGTQDARLFLLAKMGLANV